MMPTGSLLFFLDRSAVMSHLKLSLFLAQERSRREHGGGGDEAGSGSNQYEVT